MMYTIEGKDYILTALDTENFIGLEQLAGKEDVVHQSLLYHSDFHLMFPPFRLNAKLADNEFNNINKLFLIRKKNADNIDMSAIGIIGLSDIDWVQRRAALVLVMEQAHLAAKLSYDPAKTLLKKACEEWNMRKIICTVFREDTATRTMLKGFGFVQEGEVKEYVQFRDTAYDAVVMGLLKKDFRYVTY